MESSLRWRVHDSNISINAHALTKLVPLRWCRLEVLISKCLEPTLDPFLLSLLLQFKPILLLIWKALPQSSSVRERSGLSLRGACCRQQRGLYIVLEGKAKGFPMTYILCAINNYDRANMMCTLDYVSVPSFVAIGLRAFILVICTLIPICCPRSIGSYDPHWGKISSCTWRVPIGQWVATWHTSATMALGPHWAPPSKWDDETIRATLWLLNNHAKNA